MKKLIAVLAAILSVTSVAQANRINLDITSPIEQDLILDQDYEDIKSSGSPSPAGYGSFTDGLVSGIFDDGCEAADFGGFVAGEVALVLRGGCTFAQKSDTAFAAGAIGVIIGDIFSVDLSLLNPVSLTPLSGPTFFVSTDTLTTMQSLLTEFGSFTVTGNIPVPAPLALLGLGLVGLGVARRRKAA